MELRRDDLERIARALTKYAAVCVEAEDKAMLAPMAAGYRAEITETRALLGRVRRHLEALG